MPGLLDGLDGLPSLRPPRDADHDGRIREGTPREGPVAMRAFDDAAATRDAIYVNVLRAAKEVAPASNTRHTLALSDVRYEGPEDFPLAAQKRAILEGRTLARALKGTWTLSENATGRVLERKRTTLAAVPHYTPRGTFVLGGSEWSLANQLRLRPGVFARRKDNGELESHFNVLPGQGASFRVFMEPETGLFRLSLGQAKVPLVSALKAMGVRDAELRDAWGGDLALQNLKHDNTTTIGKLYDRLVRDKAPDATLEAKRAAVAHAFASFPLDPDVTRRTLGHPYASAGRDALLAATRKLIAINRGEAEPDDRDHLAYMTIHGPEDLLAERIGKNRGALAMALWKASQAGNLKRLPPGLFTGSVRAAITGSGLGQPGENINPLMIFDQQTRVSRLGEGGIPSTDAIPLEARNVQPSHLGYIDFLVTPESMAVGVDSRAARGARKGSDGRMYAAFNDAKTGARVWKSPQDLADKVIAFPGELAKGNATVAAIAKGRTTFVRRDQADYELPTMEDAFAPATNMVPGKSAVKGQRAVMAGRMLTQSLPLVDPEAPLVQTGVPGSNDDSYERLYGEQMGAVRSKHDGTVASVDGDRIVVRTRDGRRIEHPLYNEWPSNRKTGLNQTPVVNVGAPVSRGDLLARSNYTDAEGTTALGKNARVAYLADQGHNFEDAISISDSFARKLTSEHYYQHAVDNEPGVKIHKGHFTAVFPSRYNHRQLDAMDDDGVVRPGTVVQPGDPLVLASKERERTFNSLQSGRSPSFSDASETWSHHDAGVVTDVAKTKDGALVVVKAHAPMQVGDKMSGRHGDKGVVSRIIPDHEMPRDKDGRPFEVLANPLGIITRTNPAQMVEAALGKIAERTGKPYRVQDFHRIEDLTRYAMDELRRHGLDPSGQEDVIDPATGRKIPGVFTGNRFFMKLHHSAESKVAGRGTGGYTAEGTPAKGGETGSKRWSLMHLNAILSSGATNVVRDAGAVRGQAHAEYWQRVMEGHDPPTPKISLVYQKFINQLRAAGINPVREGSRTHVMALTDRDIDALAGKRALENAETVDWKGGLKPVAGGLFDETRTGGHGGSLWSSFPLAERMVNPVMEQPVRRVLGLTEKEFRGVLAGRRRLGAHTGPEALYRALDKIDLPRALDEVRQQVKSGRRAERDAALRKFGYLKAAQAVGVHPRDWMLSKVPVLPPVFRPVSLMAGGAPLIADANMLYKELFEANKNLKEMTGRVADTGEEREAVYDALKAVVGLGDPVTAKNQQRQVKGILKQVFGATSKYSAVQRKLLGGTTDLVGRGVVSPDPELDMDSVGLPEDRAWEVYRPFVIRGLVRKGVPRLAAVRAVEARDPQARAVLADELDARPVILDRAPVLHRYGVIGLLPRLVKGDTIRVNPFIVKGLAMDFDGDTSQFHVPASDEAIQDVYDKMLPSKNLISPATFKAHQLPQNEFAGGLYTASTARNESERPRVFATRHDAIRAWRRGDIDVGTPVQVLQDEEQR